jgi:hypothetical protein
MKTVRALTLFGTLATFVGSTIVSSVGLCMIPRTPVAPLSIYNISWQSQDFRKGLDASLITPIQSLNVTRSEDVAKMIPADMAPSSDFGAVSSQILDRSISSLFNSPLIRNSDIGRTAHQMEKSMESNIELGGAEPDSIKHSFKFAMKAAQTRAQIEYSGLTNAQLSYQIAGSTLDFEVREPVAAIGTQVVFNHIDKPSDRTDVVSLRWDWP